MKNLLKLVHSKSISRWLQLYYMYFKKRLISPVLVSKKETMEVDLGHRLISPRFVHHFIVAFITIFECSEHIDLRIISIFQALFKSTHICSSIEKQQIFAL